MRKVCIVQRRLTHYRLPLFETLRASLAQRDIELALLIGQPTAQEAQKQDSGSLAWATTVPTYYLAGGRICWQPLNGHLADADLTIVTQENKLLYNHLMLMLPRRRQLAFWGHGANLQSTRPDGLLERYKRWTTRQVDWWFAYTQMSADLVAQARFPTERVTILNNAVDTSALKRHAESITPEETAALRMRLGFGAGPIGIYVGSLYPDKRLDFLFKAAERIQQSIPDFKLVVVGDGPERDKVASWCGERQWARWVGVQFGRDKALHLSTAQLLLNPGLVGLGILDSFACGVPMITTHSGNHSPEIAYLQHGVNGLMLANDLGHYADACIRLLQDESELDTLRRGCVDGAAAYTVENMAANFVEGIERCLDMPRQGRGGLQ